MKKLEDPLQLMIIMLSVIIINFVEYNARLLFHAELMSLKLILQNFFLIIKKIF